VPSYYKVMAETNENPLPRVNAVNLGRLMPYRGEIAREGQVVIAARARFTGYLHPTSPDAPAYPTRCTRSLTIGRRTSRCPPRSSAPR